MIINISDYVLLGILLQCQDIDKVSLSLTCKKLYRTVTKYGVFRIDCWDWFRGEEQFKQHVRLQSYLPNIKRSLDHIFYVADMTAMNSIPDNATHLVFSNEFNFVIPPGTIPFGVTRIDFGMSFNQTLQVKSLPDTLQHLTFKYHFNRDLVVGVFPPSLTHLTLSTLFNRPLLPGVLPSSLKTLAFGLNFDQPMPFGVLPQSLQTISFGFSFNQPLGSNGVVLPTTNLKQLTFGYRFTQEIPIGGLPSTVEKLEFHTSHFPVLAAGALPQNLTHLSINDSENALDLDVLPNTLKFLKFTGENLDERFAKFANLEELTLGREFTGPIEDGVLPNSILRLHVGSLSSIFTLPPQCQHLSIDSLIPNQIYPTTLTSVHLYETFVPADLPQSVTSVSLSTGFTTIDDPIPPHVKSICFNVTRIDWKQQRNNQYISLALKTIQSLDSFSIRDTFSGEKTTFHILSIDPTTNTYLIVTDKNLYGMFFQINDSNKDRNILELLNTPLTNNTTNKSITPTDTTTTTTTTL